ncbi:39S ribosomal protein L21, mitochondrial [Coccinella septempunctata]|uniref:39S ribosomal protein L21, mitochondrial n=1 Tax=Coccinella septempunctata TaxID=41139 RepID=UPI001D06682E|nr:39S ribosomal protein L21, mitochondrial [Coccinella septempunctata]
MTSFLKNILPKLNFISKHPNLAFSKTILPNITKLNYFSNLPQEDPLTPYEVIKDDKVKEAEDKIVKSEIVKKITEKVSNVREPIFAVVHVAGKQFKITSGDIIVVEGYWPPDAGDKLTLDKIMLVGGKEFSLIGKPLIQRDLVKIEATVIEKTLSHTKIHFRKKRRKQYMRINFYRIPQTMVLINNIKFVGELDNPPDVSEPKSRSM